MRPFPEGRGNEEEEGMKRLVKGIARGVYLLPLLAACGGGGGSNNDADNSNQEPVYAIGGTVTGLSGGVLVLQNNARDDLVIEADGSFRFATELLDDSAYLVTIATQPSGQECTLERNVGILAGADINDIIITCTPASYAIGGTVTGLTTRDLVLQNNGGDDLTLAYYNLSYRFHTHLINGSQYEVTIASQPTGQRCTLSNASGTLAGHDVTNVHIFCETVFTLGGTVSGLSGSGLTLQNNGGDEFAVAEDGGFVFTTALTDYSSYSVTIASQPENQTCRVVNGSGAIAGSAIRNVSVLCPSDEFIPLVSADSPKVLTISWSDQGADHYRLLKNPDGISGYTRLGGEIRGLYAQDEISVHLTDWLNLSYIVQACSANAVCVNSAPVSAAPVMLDAIGYIKASNTDSGDGFGWPVALSADGTTLAVAATGEDSSETGIDGRQTNTYYDSNSGAVYIFLRENAVWRQQAYIKASNRDDHDGFGGELALSSSGDTLAVAASNEDSAATGINGDQQDNSAPGAGAVYLFQRSGGSWAQQAYIKATNAQAGDLFGGSLALSGDGNILAVGAQLEDSSALGVQGSQSSNSILDSGAVYLFARNDDSWLQVAYIKASNADREDFFGAMVALSADGNTLAVEAPGEDSSAIGVNGVQQDDTGDGTGAVYVFFRGSFGWRQQAYIKASNTDDRDAFGISLALSNDGNILAVGATGESSSAIGVSGDQDDNSADYSGAVYLFERSAGEWQQQAYVKASNTEHGDQFGGSVGLAANGTMLLVRAVYEDSDAVGIGGDQLNNSAIFDGAAYLFTRGIGNWQQDAYIKPPISGHRSFGYGLAISDDGATLAVGTPGDDSSATGIDGDRTDTSSPGAGAVYLY